MFRMKSLKRFITFMVMCFLFSIVAFDAQATSTSSKKNVPEDGIIEVDRTDSLAKSSFYTIELYKGNTSRSFTTIEIEIKGDTDPDFTVKKDGSKILLKPIWSAKDNTLELDVSAYLDTTSTYRYTVSSKKANFDNDDIKNLRSIKFGDIEDTGGEGILYITGMYLEDMRDLLIESTSALSHVRSLEQSYIKSHGIRVKKPYIESDKVSATSMDIVGTALNIDPNDDALWIEFLDGKTKRTRDLEDDLGDDVTRSVSIEIDIATGELSGDDLNFPITITMKPPTGISATDLYILHYFDSVNGSYEIIKPRENSNGTITFSTSQFSTFIFVNTSNRGSASTGDQDKINGSWGKDSKGWYFIDERGFSPNTTWKKVGSKWYYFDTNGYMETGWLEHENKWYYLNSDGDMATGWKHTGGKWYFLNSNGDMATGWKHTGGKWYFLNPSGDMATGWKLTGGKWYFLNPSGDMATGWKLTGGKWYFLNPNGDMATGWRQVNKVWYYMYPNGQMAANTVTPDGYRVNASGAWIR